MQTRTANRAGAERWLTIAEKLLTAGDLHATRSFAIRARESDPGLEPAVQILAVADTLLAGEAQINNNGNGSNQHDWYSILQLARPTWDSELVATQYRRLALLLNPVKNKLAFADRAFKLVSDAWSVLSNPSKKAQYDSELGLSQPGHETRGHKQQSQSQQQVRKSPRNKDGKVVIEEETPVNFTNNSNNTKSTRPTPITEPDSTASFWTACPYCYVLYEYNTVYEECTLRCQNCQRAFQAVVLPSPPLTGKDTYFCCWGFFPLGISGTNAKDTGESFRWNPISPMFACPGNPNPNVTPSRGVGRPKKANVSAPNKAAAPRVYYDEQDVYVELSDSSGKSDDDDDWEDERRKKKAKNLKGKSPAGKNNVGREEVAVAATAPEVSKKAAGSSGKKQTDRGVKELGKLDLNVEFSNEVEETVQEMPEGNGARNGEEDNIEGIGFFEGLDEFLSSLPILSVVGDDKAKAT